MAVKVLYFAALKDLTHPQSDGKDVVDLNLLETPTLGKLVQYLVDVKYTDRSQRLLEMFQSCMVALNCEYVDGTALRIYSDAARCTSFALAMAKAPATTGRAILVNEEYNTYQGDKYHIQCFSKCSACKSVLLSDCADRGVRFKEIDGVFTCDNCIQKKCDPQSRESELARREAKAGIEASIKFTQWNLVQFSIKTEASLKTTGKTMGLLNKLNNQISSTPIGLGSVQSSQPQKSLSHQVPQQSSVQSKVNGSEIKAGSGFSLPRLNESSAISHRDAQ
ncbi:hypothetical protein MP228_005757 [Amoeboaphelidium protococcarum]|nr:hypothetical protein MP228_007245 [Amoeboaphelidium protococcarum]KAI3649388.1 hypothetical protein MP228_005757 [Amoeboaphelidium protococcarum]